ncbi:hypothetical protein JCM9279_004969 [Rhodotorula babjevae]
MEPPSRSPKEVLHSQLDRLYDWLLAWSLPPVIRTAVTNSQVAFKRSVHWDALLPHERAKVVDLVLSSYVELWTRRPQDAFDWSSIKYRDLLKMVGVRAGTVADRKRMRYEQARHVYDAVLASIDRVERECWGRPDALASFARWRDELCSGSGITIVKLQRIERVAPGAVLRLLNAAVDQVEAQLRTGRLPGAYLPSGDELFVLARTPTQSASKRFADFLLYLADLDKLYRSRAVANYQPDEAHLLQLDVARATLQFVEHEGHFARLLPGQQLEALDRGRGVLFSACAELRRLGRLPDPAARIGQLNDAIGWPGVPQEQQPIPSYFPLVPAAPPSHSPTAHSPPAPQHFHHHHHLPTSPSSSTPTAYSFSPTSSASTSSPAYFSPTLPQARSPGVPPSWLAAPSGAPHGPPAPAPAPQSRTWPAESSRAAVACAQEEEERARAQASARRRR